MYDCVQTAHSREIFFPAAIQYVISCWSYHNLSFFFQQGERGAYFLTAEIKPRLLSYRKYLLMKRQIVNLFLGESLDKLLSRIHGCVRRQLANLMGLQEEGIFFLFSLCAGLLGWKTPSSNLVKLACPALNRKSERLEKRSLLLKLQAYYCISILCFENLYRRAPVFAGVLFPTPPRKPETVDTGHNFLKIGEHQYFCCDKVKKRFL